MPTAKSADGVQIEYTVFGKPEAKALELGRLGVFMACGGEALSLTLANFEVAHRLRGTRNIGSFSTIS
jgi:hypothetical protein